MVIWHFPKFQFRAQGPCLSADVRSSENRWLLGLLGLWEAVGELYLIRDLMGSNGIEWDIDKYNQTYMMDVSYGVYQSNSW
jgi:hypothetical protein